LREEKGIPLYLVRNRAFSSILLSRRVNLPIDLSNRAFVESLTTNVWISASIKTSFQFASDSLPLFRSHRDLLYHIPFLSFSMILGFMYYSLHR
jgi:hypothetical protein